jgi:hypothetical protein
MRRILSALSGVAQLLLILLISGQDCQGMDRWAALSQLESGDDDSAIGSAGEVSRYQVRPQLWERYALPKMNWQTAADALKVAQKIMQDRCAAFENTFRRQPTDLEFYILWNAPSQVSAPTKAIQKRAERFCNLINRPEL